MTNLRGLAEDHLKFSLEGTFALPVVLISPDAVKDEVSGQVLYETLISNPTTGEEITVDKPVVVLRISSLLRTPQDGEKWFVQIPESPKAGADIGDYIISPTRPTEGGRSIGFIRLYLQKIEQSL